MEALAAVSLAGNILQFVDTAKSLISSSRQLSSTGANKEHIELSTIACELQSLVSRITPEESPNRMKLSKEEESIRALSKQCNEVAVELLAVLDTLKAKRLDGSHVQFENFYKALLGEWKKGEVANLQKRLDRIGTNIQTHLTAYDSKKIFQRLDQLSEKDNSLQGYREVEIKELRGQFRTSFEDLEKKLQQNESRNHVMTALLDAARKGSRYSAEQIILEHLRFDTIYDRHDSIRTAHEQTLSWLFGKGTQRSPATFDDWLSSDDDNYWISGKPGSGKSTMMKFLCENPQTIDKLKIWAGSERLVKAEYFFWISGGNELQKSQEGLLRTLVYQILRQCPDMIPQAYPTTWQLYCPEESSTMKTRSIARSAGATVLLSIQGLLTTLQSICKAAQDSEAKFCFLIDGLDEYEGKPIDMIELIRVLRTLPNLKLCLSSRSWDEFEHEFGKDGTRKLYMHDFNSNDISAYVHDTFARDENYQDLEDIDMIGNLLIQEIVKRANGVFLWVFLVVRSFQEGLINGDSISNFKRRLDELPTDLNEYFERILLSDVAEFYRGQSAELFSVALEGEENLPLMAYWHMGAENPDYALKLEVKQLSMRQISMRLKTMKQRLNACCKGLLEVRQLEPRNERDSFDWKVNFLHRSVRDYLALDDTQVLLKKWCSKGFDIQLTICRALLAQIKTSPDGDEYWGVNAPVSQLAGLIHRQINRGQRSENWLELCKIRTELQTVLVHKAIVKQEGPPQQVAFDETRIVVELPASDEVSSEAPHVRGSQDLEDPGGGLKNFFGRMQRKCPQLYFDSVSLLFFIAERDLLKFGVDKLKGKPTKEERKEKKREGRLKVMQLDRP